jgi:hypothetical protein
MNIKPIETRYKGYRFRSRLEARWAVFFDALGIVWEYEKEGYELPSGRYLPDFWLPSIVVGEGDSTGAWIEIKPEYSQRSIDLLVQLTTMTGHASFLAGSIDEKEGTHFFQECQLSLILQCGPEWVQDIAFMKCSRCGLLKLQCPLEIDYNGDYNGCFKCGGEWCCFEDHQDISRAVSAARSARFEFGERP